MITIVDYKAGNILSILNMLRKIGVESCITSDPLQIATAEKIILPGVGHYDHGMRHMNELGLTDAIRQKVIHDKVPVLGICLGAQLMGQSSEEGNYSGLGLVNMQVIKFDRSRMDSRLKVPHMGWDDVEIKQQDCPLFTDMHADPRYYFVHSYHFQMDNANDVLTTSNHGYPFTSSFWKENIFGVQFHPEKSHKYGMKLLENFVRL